MLVELCRGTVLVKSSPCGQLTFCGCQCQFAVSAFPLKHPPRVLPARPAACAYHPLRAHVHSFKLCQCRGRGCGPQASPPSRAAAAAGMGSPGPGSRSKGGPSPSPTRSGGPPSAPNPVTSPSVGSADRGAAQGVGIGLAPGTPQGAGGGGAAVGSPPPNGFQTPVRRQPSTGTSGPGPQGPGVPNAGSPTNATSGAGQAGNGGSLSGTAAGASGEGAGSGAQSAGQGDPTSVGVPGPGEAEGAGGATAPTMPVAASPEKGKHGRHHRPGHALRACLRRVKAVAAKVWSLVVALVLGTWDTLRVWDVSAGSGTGRQKISCRERTNRWLLIIGGVIMGSLWVSCGAQVSD